MRRLFIRTSKTQGEATLYTEINLRRAGFRAIIPLPLTVNVAKWKAYGQKWDAGYKDTKEGKTIANQLEEIFLAINNAIKDLGFVEEGEEGHGVVSMISPAEAKRYILEAIDDIRFKKAREAKAIKEDMNRREAEAQAERERIAKAQEDADVRKYLANLIDGMKSGRIRIKGRGRNKGRRYTDNSIKMWKNLQGVIGRFYEQQPFTWDSIDEAFASSFRTWLENEGYMVKSINKYVGLLIALINRAKDEGKHTNYSAANVFLIPSVDEAQKAAEIFITADELNALYQMPLTGEKALVRDFFIIGCCTCQRVSDYTRLRKENFVMTARGTKVVKIQQQKTKNTVTIPILDNKLTDIMERYDYNLPQLPTHFDQILNRYIKEICKELAETVPSLNEEIPTILTMRERAIEAKAIEESGKMLFKRDEAGRVVKPRYELVTSHTARRTGITHLYLTGKFDIYQMMHVSGHKEAKTFREYIKLSGDEMAEQIAEKMGSDNLF